MINYSCYHKCNIGNRFLTKHSNILERSSPEKRKILLKAIVANAESHLRFDIALKQRLKAFYGFKRKEKRFKSKIYFRRKAYQNLTHQQQRANAARSKVSGKVEHAFAHQKHTMGLFIRTIGIDRAQIKIG